MKEYRRSLRVGAFAIACALLLRLNGLFYPLAEFLAQADRMSMMVYLETGRFVQQKQQEVRMSYSPESPPPLFPEPVSMEKPAFTAEEAADVEIRNDAKISIDAGELLTRPLSWELCGTEPTVLIYHTHTTESYTKNGETYEETSPYRTTDEGYNVVSVGDRIQKALEAAGITVVHDRTIHDYPQYNGSYGRSRKTIEADLKQYPSICLALDIHRDAVGDTKQWKSTVKVGNQTASQLMVVVGSNGSGSHHPNWQENLALGLKLHVQLEKIVPGICRHVNLRAQKFNQDELPGALLVEVGTAGNTHQEALYAADVLAQGIISLAHGTE